MFLDFISQSLPLGATEETGFVSALLTQILLWGQVALGIGLVIFVHELGHFLAAKTFGVKCEKFYVGFDVPIKIGPIKFPRTLGKFQYGETEYGIGILPFGGYVKMLGQDDDPRKAEQEAKRIRSGGEAGDGEEEVERLDPRSYPAKPVWQRMIIISAGVVMNLVTGVLFAAIAFGYGVSYNPAIIGGVSPGGPAWRAGIEPGGQVISVGELSDDQMHFREMRVAIVSEGLEYPDKPIDVAIRYDDGIRQYKLKTDPHPVDSDLRMIGITNPTSLKLSSETPALPGSVADGVLSEADGGASIIAYDGNEVRPNSIVPSTPFFDYLYSHPDKTISLTLERADNTTHTVELPPQQAKSIGFRYAISPITALVEEGAAAKAGIQVGDVIVAVNGNTDIDAYGLPLMLFASEGPVSLQLRRGQGEQSRTIDVELTAESSPQTLSTTSGIDGQIAINRFGFSYSPRATVATVMPNLLSKGSGSSDTELEPGDEIKEVRLILSDAELPKPLKDDRFAPILEQLREGWKADGPMPLGALVETIQLLPEGTPLRVFATRSPRGRVIESVATVQQDDRVWPERGLALTAVEATQTADSFASALSLGFREGKRRLADVFRFLQMIPKGRVKMRHVGGPLEIVNMAKNQAERGISPQLLFLTMLSMNLAILNFLPIPALDGGHMVFLIAEAIRGKKLDEQLEMRLTMAGVLTILLLMVVVFANDIMRRL
ncbi:site-2 protease family protein [Novipirellula artificiosorum]|uniref:Putative zinc metalloprotease n=1 Tax=Novipirellula artificiosorum TaxID=2528016 RepID=A0A5C6E087_9BACT|nr:site-2 protease family protein [Novipirellula artificiosorum]TWU41111.1 putative zinc metalloprotease [Novipirellula artificiosorum]